MTNFNADTYAQGLTVKALIADIDAGTVTQAQGLAICEAKTSRENIRKGALARWTRVAEGLKAGAINPTYAFTGKDADEPKAVIAVKHKNGKISTGIKAVTRAAKQTEPTHIQRMTTLVGKKIMSRNEREELSGLIATYVAR